MNFKILALKLHQYIEYIHICINLYQLLKQPHGENQVAQHGWAAAAASAANNVT